MNKRLIDGFTMLFLILLPCGVTLAQSEKETLLRNLEDKEREAVLNSDSAALYDKLWSPALVLNTPANRVGTVDGTKMQLRTGKLKYQSFERSIEKVTFNGDLAIVMGEEKIKPQGQQEYAGKIVIRRFTNVWRYADKSWSMIVRQATIIRVD